VFVPEIVGEVRKRPAGTAPPSQGSASRYL